MLSLVHTGDKVEFNRSTLLKVDCCRNRQQSRLLPYTFNFVADMVDFVASVYGAKATRSTLSTFSKVDRVEFNFVASVYQALGLPSTGKELTTGLVGTGRAADRGFINYRNNIATFTKAFTAEADLRSGHWGSG